MLYEGGERECLCGLLVEVLHGEGGGKERREERGKEGGKEKEEECWLWEYCIGEKEGRERRRRRGADGGMLLEGCC